MPLPHRTLATRDLSERSSSAHHDPMASLVLFGLMLFILGATTGLLGCADDDLQETNNKPPTAEAGDPLEAFAGELVVFDGSASVDDDGEIVRYEWDFGDGTSGEGQTASHIYNEGGFFTVTLRVTDNREGSDTDTVIVTVGANARPVAVITAPDEAPMGSNVRFSGADSEDSDGSISTWTWDFGDGTEGAGMEVDKSFDEPGTYQVKLTVTDDEGATGEVVHQIGVTEDINTSLDGTWQWFLVDESQRELPGLCGTFQDSMLSISVDAPQISIVEQAGGQSVPYSGTIGAASDMGFEVMNSSELLSQTITGTFTSMTTFEGVYGVNILLDLLGEDCADRAVTGVKVQ